MGPALLANLGKGRASGATTPRPATTREPAGVPRCHAMHCAATAGGDRTVYRP